MTMMMPMPLRDELSDGLRQLMKDAERYRWLREQDWFSSPLCVLRDPKQALTKGAGLGADCPSLWRLDSAIDEAMAAAALAPQPAE